RDFHVTGVQTCALPISDNERDLGLINRGNAQGNLKRMMFVRRVKLSDGCRSCSALEWISLWQHEESSTQRLTKPCAFKKTNPLQIGRASCRERRKSAVV